MEYSIVATDKEKKAHINYEVWMFQETCNRLIDSKISEYPTPSEQFEYNLLIESFATHVRTLVDFFYNDRNEKYPNDLLAQDFLLLVLAGKICDQKNKILEEAKSKTNWQVAHISLQRVQLERDGKKGWIVFEIQKELKSVIEKFYHYAVK